MNNEVENIRNEQRTMNAERRFCWFVLQTKPNAESEVTAKLKQAGVEVFYPRLKTLVRGKKRQVERLKSLFPLYVFVHIELDNQNIYHMLKYTRGVNRLLGVGGKPLPIPDELVAVIKERVNDEDVVEQALVLKKGDNVRLLSGPLQDLVGILEKPVSDSGRVRVLLEVMHKVVRVETACSDIEQVT